MNRIFSYIDRNKAELLNVTKKLVSIATVNPPGENYEEMAELLEGYCRKLEFKTRRIETPKAVLLRHKIRFGSRRINLIADWNIGAKNTLHLNGHYDVVPAIGKWKSEPFKPVIRNKRIYARGAEDMKGFIACIFMALEAIKANNIKPLCNIQLSFTPDEEIGSETGFKYLVNRGLIKADYAIGEGYSSDCFSYGNKGLVWLKVEVKGESCHSCEPHKGINSFEKMVILAAELIKLKNKAVKKKTAFKTKSGTDRYSTMVMGGELSGGDKINIVPAESMFTIDRRILPEESAEDAIRQIEEVIEKLRKKDKDLKVKLHIISKENAVVYKNGDNDLFKVFSDSVNKVTGKRPKRALLAGATDMRFLIRKGIPCVGYSPDGGNTCHSANECVKIKSLIDTTKIFADLIANLA